MFVVKYFEFWLLLNFDVLSPHTPPHAPENLRTRSECQPQFQSRAVDPVVRRRRPNPKQAASETGTPCQMRPSSVRCLHPASGSKCRLLTCLPRALARIRWCVHRSTRFRFVHVPERAYGASPLPLNQQQHIIVERRLPIHPSHPSGTSQQQRDRAQSGCGVRPSRHFHGPSAVEQVRVPPHRELLPAPVALSFSQARF